MFYESVENETYNNYSKTSNPELKNVFNDQLYHVAPSCKGGILSVDYYLKVNLKFHNSSDEKFLIPIDFCLRQDENTTK